MEVPTRRVTFHTDTKEYDGMHPMHQLLDDIVQVYFQHQLIHSVDNMRDYLKDRWIPTSTTETDYLDHLCVDLVERAKRLGAREMVQVLPQGGGRGYRIYRAHVPHINQMCRWIQMVIEERRLAFQFARPYPDP